MEERIQKLMAQAGLGSRRACEEVIAAGRVTVNGKAVKLGDKADPQQDRIVVDGRPLKLAAEHIYIALYKPRGVLSTVSAPDPRPTVRDLVELPGHFYPVGRLDVESEGLILLTDDGELANRLTHPRYGHEKEYRVLVARRPDDAQLETWRRGVVLEDGYRTAPAEVRMIETYGKGAWLRVTLREGRKRQIRETGGQIGLPVVKIVRVRIGTLYLSGLKPRQWRHLTPEEVAGLKGDAQRMSKKPVARKSPQAKPPAARHPNGQKTRPPARKPAPASSGQGGKPGNKPARSPKPGNKPTH
jgi:23S rRNA pseudouridine2605 synthase